MLQEVPWECLEAPSERQEDAESFALLRMTGLRCGLCMCDQAQHDRGLLFFRSDGSICFSLIHRQTASALPTSRPDLPILDSSIGSERFS